MCSVYMKTNMVFESKFKGFLFLKKKIKRFLIWRTKLKLTPRETSRNNFNVKIKIKGNIKDGELEVVFKRKNRPTLDCTPWKFPKCISHWMGPIGTNVNATYHNGSKKIDTTNAVMTLESISASRLHIWWERIGSKFDDETK